MPDGLTIFSICIAEAADATASSARAASAAEAKSRVSSNSGVNLDEELTSLSSYQQAYAAGARILSVVDQLYQTLLQIQ